MLSTMHDWQKCEAGPSRHPIVGRADRRRCRRDGEPYDGTDRRTRHYFHLDRDGRARAAREIFLTAGAVATELLRCDCRRSERRRQQPTRPRRRPAVAASYRLGLATEMRSSTSGITATPGRNLK